MPRKYVPTVHGRKKYRQLLLPFPGKHAGPLTERLIYHTYQPAIRDAVAKHMAIYRMQPRRNIHTLNDYVQDTILMLIRKRIEYDPNRGDHFTFIDRVAKSIVNARRRRKKIEQKGQGKKIKELSRKEGPLFHNEKTRIQEDRSWVIQHLHKLTPLQQKVVLLRMDGFSHAEIGMKIYEKSPSINLEETNTILANRVQSALNNAVKRLQAVHLREKHKHVK